MKYQNMLRHDRIVKDIKLNMHSIQTKQAVQELKHI